MTNVTRVYLSFIIFAVFFYGGLMTLTREMTDAKSLVLHVNDVFESLSSPDVLVQRSKSYRLVVSPPQNTHSSL